MYLEAKLLKMPIILFVLMICFVSNSSFSQKKQSFPVRYIRKIFFDTTAKSEPQFIVYPIAAYSPETNFEFGLSSLYVRYAKGDTNNRLSEINALAFYTLEKQYGGVLEHAIYSDKNRWFFLGKLKFQSFPLSYYGIGPSSTPQKKATVEAISFQVKERVLHKIHQNIYGGLEFDLQHLGNVNFNIEEGQQVDLPLGHEGSTNLGIGLGLLYDNRHNVLNVRDGFFAEAAVLHYNDAIGSAYKFTSLFTDLRYFLPIRKRNTLALHTYGQFTFGNAPFNHLAQIGGESMMRGYYLGRFRDQHYLATQLEYRMLPFSFAKRFGAAIFASTGSVFNDSDPFHPNKLLLAGGAGLRFQLFPKKDVWLRFDLAFTNEGNGVYIFIGEDF
jgi:outer membrane protein assembly factor BamA